MAEPTLSDILKSIEKLSTETETRHASLANESRERDRAQTEGRVRLEAKVEQSVQTLTLGLTNLNSDVTHFKSQFPKLETMAQDAHKNARVALDSYTALETAGQEHWRSVMSRLEQQDSDRDRIEKEKREDAERKETLRKEELKRESIAAARVAEEKEKAAARAAEEKEKEATRAAAAREADAVRAAKEREHRAKVDAVKDQEKTARQKIWSTVIQAVAVSAFASGSVYGGVRLARQDTDAKIDALSVHATTLARKVDAVAVAVAVPDAVSASSSPGAASSPPEPAFPASAPALASPRAPTTPAFPPARSGK